ncbi:MAG: LysR family transcriptional regulator [Bacteroidota bacterium]
MISPAQVRYILSLLEHKNFQRASNACFVTQPTLSMQIKKAEEALGSAIFNRDTQPLSLTHFGSEILPFLQEMEASYNALNDKIEQTKGNYKAEVRLGIIPTIAGYLVPELYAKWQREMGDIQLDIIELKSTSLLDAIDKKEIDMGIMAGPLSDVDMHSQVLFNEEILVYNPDPATKTLTQDQLNQLRPWLLSEGNCLRTQMINFCNLETPQKNEWSYQGGSLNILLKMVELEGGYTLVPKNYLPYLSQQRDYFKTVKHHIPIRQIVGVHLSRNTKKSYLNNIMRVIQRNKANNDLHKKHTELLPWD